MAVHPDSRAVARCAEFPNDNPALHRGAIWCCVAVGGAAVCEAAAPSPGENPPEPAEPTPTEPIVLSAGDCAVIWATPAPAAPEGEGPSEPTETALAPPSEERSRSAEPVVDEDEDIEVVDELACGDVVAEESPPVIEEPSEEEVMEEPSQEEEEAALAEERAAEDPFAALVRVLEEVAYAAGCSGEAVQGLRALLGVARLDASAMAPASIDALVAGGLLDRGEQGVARAEGLSRQITGWQGILRGESEDFSACGAAMLDEWCAQLLARAMGNASRADGFRKELRRRGVAAFGIVVSAA